MPRETYVIRDGQLVPKRFAAPAYADGPYGVAIIGDHVAPFRSMVDGRTYDSKSAYAASLREASARTGRDYQVVGNDHRALMGEPGPYRSNHVERDTARALERLHAVRG